jgi:hypothetical protein
MLAPVLSALLAAAALSVSTPVNLDPDPGAERLVKRETTCFTDGSEHRPPCTPDDVVYRMVSVIDDCGTGPQDLPLLREPHETFTDVRAVEADGNRSYREILAEGYSGASGRIGEARLLRLAGRRPGASGCLPPKVLFEIPSRRWATAKPEGASYASTGFVQVRDIDPRLPGREVVLRQPWYRTDDGGCCPTWEAVAVFRYDKTKDTYVKARERVRRFLRPR